MNRVERVERAPARDGYGWDASWTGWHLSWGSVFVGALAGLVAAVLFSLIALAIGAHKVVDDRILKWADVGPATIIFSVLGAFFASVIGAWVAAKMSGARRAEHRPALRRALRCEHPRRRIPRRADAPGSARAEHDPGGPEYRHRDPQRRGRQHPRDAHWPDGRRSRRLVRVHRAEERQPLPNAFDRLRQDGCC